MPIVEIWDVNGRPFHEISQIKSTVTGIFTGIKELGLSESDITIIFASEKTGTYRFGTPESEIVIVNIYGLFLKPERTDEVRNRLARVIGYYLSSALSVSESEGTKPPLVEVLVWPFDERWGYWTNKTAARAVG